VAGGILFRLFSSDLQTGPAGLRYLGVDAGNRKLTIKENEVHIQVVNFHLKDLRAEEYSKLCDQLAPTFAEIPGLISKVWLADQATNTYGGVYTWRNREAMVAFTKTDLFASVVSHPNLSDIKSTDFSVLEAPTRVTRGLTAVPA
jgi:heme-degrading monooxygenase HmoA